MQEERRTKNKELTRAAYQRNMEFKVFLLCFAVFVVTTSAASVCKCEDKEETVSKYKVKIKDGDKEVDEEVEVDTEKQTEKFHIPKTESSNAGEVDVVYDFKRNVAMHRLSAGKACFLSDSTENLPKPDDLAKILNKESNDGSSQAKQTTDYEYEVVGTVNDRSDLSDEMATLCAKLPIYRIKEKKLVVGVEKRVKRGCWYVCYLRCWGGSCVRVCVRRCS
ncbi:hypothetical protein ACROYT_G019786 [Oculina patagonica]